MAFGPLGRIHDFCEAEEVLGGKQLFVSCRHNTFDGEKAMVTQSRYAIDLPSAGLSWIQDPRIYRRNSAF
jgi:hypothetical protein